MTTLSNQFQLTSQRLQRRSKQLTCGLLLCVSLPVVAETPWPVGIPVLVWETVIREFICPMVLDMIITLP